MRASCTTFRQEESDSRQISDGFLFTGQQVVDDKLFHVRYGQTFSAPDELRVRFEVSRDDVAYEPFWESLLTRAHPAVDRHPS